MSAFEQKLQEVRDSLDELMDDQARQIDEVRDDAPEDFEYQRYLYDRYTDLRNARKFLGNPT